jgi:hypothetical protein
MGATTGHHDLRIGLTHLHPIPDQAIIMNHDAASNEIP